MIALEIINADCLKAMREMPDGCVDAIVTDPPYGLAFMGSNWDHNVPSVSYWSECLRVAKPGAHLLCFGGTRTFHRLMCAIEDAGWEIRDTIMWVYGSGFPKSMDVGKAIDKVRGKSENFQRMYAKAVKDSGMSHAEIDRELGIKSSSCYWVRTDERKSFPTRENWEILKHILPLPDNADEIYDEAERFDRVVGHYGDNTIYDKSKAVLDAGTPITQQAKEWDGWGTCLKPAWEPIIVARKPLDGTVAHNVMTYGTGAINIDACRVPTSDVLSFGNRQIGDGVKYGRCTPTTEGKQNEKGRFPANLVHDGSQMVLGLFPQSKGQQGDVTGNEPSRPADGVYYGEYNSRHTFAKRGDTGSAARFFNELRDGEESANRTYTDRGGTNFAAKPGKRREPTSADRFFYCAKASKKDRGDGNDHPTVKPTALMEWLVKLVTAEGQTVLDPFMGSGSTGVACERLGRRFVGIEKDEHFCEVAEARLAKENDGRA